MSDRETVLAAPDAAQVRAETERLAKRTAAAAEALRTSRVGGGGGFDDDADDAAADSGGGGHANEEQEDEHVKEAKRNTFEFTDNISMNRLLRMLLFIQILGVIVDHPKLRTPPLFNLLCMPGLYYSIRFYSQPFLDVVFVLQTFISSIINFWQENVAMLFASGDQAGVSSSSARRLQESSNDNGVTR
jgi:hypothetical protein